ncbi:MAG TPA: malto-oligosyltrehalose trehalohydrolase [Tepidisphaeraceae bacterium]
MLVKMKQEASAPAAKRRLAVGAEVSPSGVAFRVWAPKRKKVEVVFENGGRAFALDREEDGFFTGLDSSAKVGEQYRYRLDGEELLVPDPGSRYQPQGVHGPSQIVDPSTFKWTDEKFPGINPEDVVLYEFHVGTFTPEGTWRAAAEKLPHLKELGITCLEMMPIADFAGESGWGYDGVSMFAPTRLYGSPDDLRFFVNRAHELGLAVILDVVYNHLGPDGNYIPSYSDTFFSKKHATGWGEAINYDDEGSVGVRQFFIANARYWIDEFHFDGYRFDATQNIYDDSKPHILAEISQSARGAAPHKNLYLITENDEQNTNMVRSVDDGGNGMTGLWNDEFHHSALVYLTGRNEAFYVDHNGAPQEFVSALKYGYLYQGQKFKFLKYKRRGMTAFDLPPHAFVNYLQNHDQIANFGQGLRVDKWASPAALRAMTLLTLLAPQSPMFFQGQEWAASTRFNYFAGQKGELAKLIREGRLKELQQFPSVADPEFVPLIPYPDAPETFQNCKLDWSEIDQGHHKLYMALHRDLLKIRREDPVLTRSRKQRITDGAVIGTSAFCIRFLGQDADDRLIVVNLGTDLMLSVCPEPLMAPPVGHDWDIVISSEQPKYGGQGIQPLESRGESWRDPGENWRIPGRSATLLKPIPAKQ